jgi:hypothetical protein
LLITSTGTIGPMLKRSFGIICQFFDMVIIPLYFLAALNSRVR